MNIDVLKVIGLISGVTVGFTILALLDHNYKFVKKVEPAKTVQQQLQETKLNNLGPLVFIEAYNFHDDDLYYKVVRLETGERIFIAYSNHGVSCLKIDKR